MVANRLPSIIFPVSIFKAVAGDEVIVVFRLDYVFTGGELNVAAIRGLVGHNVLEAVRLQLSQDLMVRPGSRLGLSVFWFLGLSLIFYGRYFGAENYGLIVEADVKAHVERV